MAGKIIIPLLSQFDSAGIRQAIASVEGLGKSIGGLRGILGGLAGAGIGSAAFDFIGQSVDQAKLLQNQMMALNTVFGENNTSIQSFIANSEKLALSHQEAAKAATFLGTNLKSAGFPMDDVVKKTEKLLKLSTDLAVTYGYPVQEALTAVAAMFRGEYDPIEKFGVAIKQSQVNAMLAAEGLGKLKGQALLNASTMVRYNLLMSHSSDAQGALARQSDTLVVKQAKLQAVFHDQQAALGTKLLPVLTEIATKFLSMAKDITPALQTSFNFLSQIVNNLFRSFKDAQPIFQLLGIIFGGLAAMAGALAVAISKVSGEIVAFVIVGVTIKKILWLMDALKIAWAEFALSVPPGVAGANASLITLGTGFKKLGTTMKETFKKNWVMLLIAGVVELGGFVKDQTDAAGALQKAYDNTSDAAKAMAAKAMVGVNQVSDGNVTNIGAISDAQKKLAISIQRGLDGTKKAVKSTTAALPSIASTAAKAASDQMAKTIATLRANLAKLSNVFAPQSVKANLGAMEQAVVASFTKISDFITTALENKALTQGAANAFKKYAAMEASALRKIAAQRDKVQNKLDLARTLIGDTKKAIIDFGNITNTLGDASKTITTSVSYIAGKFQVLVSASGAGANGAQKIIDNLQSVVDKTKEFGKNLKVLDKMGINETLRNQILQAGVDTGGATAKALVEGGKTSVDALNATFAQLSSAADSVGKTAAEVMYGQGVNLTDGLINGLLAQDKKLKTAAQTLAEAFSTAFNSTMNKTLGSGKTKVTFDKIDTSGLAAGTAKQLLTNVGTASSGANVTVNVSAGMGADGVAIGAEIVKVIKKYEKANGKVFSN